MASETTQGAYQVNGQELGAWQKETSGAPPVVTRVQLIIID